MKEPIIYPEQLTNFTMDGKRMTLREVNEQGMASYSQIVDLIGITDADCGFAVDREQIVHRYCVAGNIPLQGYNGFVYIDTLEKFFKSEGLDIDVPDFTKNYPSVLKGDNHG